MPAASGATTHHRGAAALAAVLLTAACGTASLPDPGGAAVAPAGVAGPAYAVWDGSGDGRDRVPGGSRVVVGGHRTALGDRTYDVTWLSSGDVLVDSGRAVTVLDPRTGRAGRSVGAAPGHLRVSPGAILRTGARSLRVARYSLDLRPRGTVTVPRSAMDTDQARDPDRASLTLGDAVVAGGATWVQWYVDSEDDDLTDHGVLRLAGGRTTSASRNRPVARLAPSSDGRSLLALVQDRGEEDCGGCVVAQHLEEWATDEGAEVTDLGMPPGYDRGWRVQRMDRVGDRVVVLFAVDPQRTGHVTTTWVRSDDGWSELVPRRDEDVAWQGGRPLVRTYAKGRALTSDDEFEVSYGTGVARRTLIPYADSCPDPAACFSVSVPGPLLEPR